MITSGVKGEFANDKITVADSELKDFNFGVADEIQIGALVHAYGIMGINYDNNITGSCDAAQDSLVGLPCDVDLTNVPDAMYQQGYSKSRSYSLYLDDSDGKSGSILFGGIDTAKFTGGLTTWMFCPFKDLLAHFSTIHMSFTKST